jgi:hypothetical protein
MTPRATLTGHASLFPGLGKTAVSTDLTLAWFEDQSEDTSANAPRGWAYVFALPPKLTYLN